MIMRPQEVFQFLALNNLGAFVKCPYSPPLVGGDEGEGRKI